MDGSENSRVRRRRRRRRRRRPGYDVLWRRLVSAIGVLIALAEIVINVPAGRPVDQNVLLFAAMLIGVPLAAGRGGEP